MILTETFRSIQSRRNLAGLFIEDILLNDFFNGVQLSDGSVGVAANYSVLLPGQKGGRIAAGLFRKIKAGDPLLVEFLEDHSGEDNLVQSIRTCIVSALSAPLLASEDSEMYRRISAIEFESRIRQKTAMVVGWGGLRDMFLNSPDVESVHVCDLVYSNPCERDRIDREARKLRSRFPHKSLTVSDGSDFASRVKDCEICAITGSALCNGTLGGVLQECEDCDLVILQGQSGSIYPEYLFREQLIDVLVTSIKPVQLLSVARQDFNLFHTVLEGGLPLAIFSRRQQGNPASAPGKHSVGALVGKPSIVEEAFQGIRSYHGTRWNDLNISAIHTGGYYTCVKLTDGSQGIATNLSRVHGPHSKPYDYMSYDNGLLQTSQGDRLLLDTILQKRELPEREKSLQIAILNALSRDMLTAGGLALRGLRVVRDVQLHSFIEKNDTVAMIGCMGNHTCGVIGENGRVGRILFSDLEYVDPYKDHVESFIAEHFRRPKIVTLSDGSENKSICQEADIAIITADTLCTDTLDDLLEWAKGARRVFVVGWSFALDPLLLLRRGVCGLTVMVPLHPDIVRASQRVSMDEFESLFVRGYLLG